MTSDVSKNMNDLLPAILQPSDLAKVSILVDHETALLRQARSLFDAGFPGHALLDLWNASVHNLRRRIESYSVEIFLSTVKDEPGRKRYDRDGETIQEKWNGLDELVLITGATRLGLLNKKAGKALEMINWMRNHASPAHDSDTTVTNEDVVALALILQKNLFEDGMPDPGHSPAGLFNPVKSTELDPDGVSLISDQIKSYRPADIRVAFGFLLDLILRGDNPGLANAKQLLPTVWGCAPDDVRGTAGYRYESLILNPESDDSTDKGGKIRLLEILVSVGGISYIPDGARATLFRRAATLLATAKNTGYGWADEEAAAKTFEQFGTRIPSICFEECYQEILAVWCGNFWGRSGAFLTLKPFFDSLNTEKLLSVARLFESNARVREELGQSKPKAEALELLNDIKSRLTIASHQGEIDRISQMVREL